MVELGLYNQRKDFKSRHLSIRDPLCSFASFEIRKKSGRCEGVTGKYAGIQINVSFERCDIKIG